MTNYNHNLFLDDNLTGITGDGTSINDAAISSAATWSSSKIDAEISLSGLTINDSTPSLTDVYSSSKIETELSGKADASHTHTASDVTDFQTQVSANTDVTTATSHIADLTLHRVINDSTPSATTLYSGTKINNELLLKSPAIHTHVAADITDFQSTVSNNADVVNNVSHASDDSKHRLIDDAGAVSSITLWSSIKTDSQLLLKSNVGHTHVSSNITDFDTEVSNNTSVAANTSHANDASKHRLINDSTPSATTLYSSNKIETELTKKQDDHILSANSDTLYTVNPSQSPTIDTIVVPLNYLSHPTTPYYRLRVAGLMWASSTSNIVFRFQHFLSPTTTNFDFPTIVNLVTGGYKPVFIDIIFSTIDATTVSYGGSLKYYDSNNVESHEPIVNDTFTNDFESQHFMRFILSRDAGGASANVFFRLLSYSISKN